MNTIGGVAVPVLEQVDCVLGPEPVHLGGHPGSGARNVDPVEDSRQNGTLLRIHPPTSQREPLQQREAWFVIVLPRAKRERNEYCIISLAAPLACIEVPP